MEYHFSFCGTREERAWHDVTPVFPLVSCRKSKVPIPDLVKAISERG